MPFPLSSACEAAPAPPPRPATGGQGFTAACPGRSPAFVEDPALSRLPACLFLLAFLAACGDRYSPDTYATRAMQQANKVEQGVVVGVRGVQISAEGTTGAATGAAAGGVLGAQTPGGGIGAALGGVGGALVGGLIGRATESAVVDSPAQEYVVRTDKDDLLSVTQRDTVPLALGQRVLLITGTQARLVPDYTVTSAAPSPSRAPARAEREAAPERPAPPRPASQPEPQPEPGAAPDEAAAAARDLLRQMVPAPPVPPVVVPPPAPQPEAGLPAPARPVAAALQ